MFGLRHKPTGFFFRAAGNQIVADVDIAKYPHNLLLLPDLWTATQFVETRLRRRAIEIVELEIREVRVMTPVLEVKPDENTGNQFPIVGGVRP
jgi:hypothetical protein